MSEGLKIQTRQASRDDHSQLLVVETDGSFRERRYAQSTSGRSISQETSPLLSRSNEITSDSPKRSPVDMTLRMYATVVPDLAAKEACSAWEREFRNLRSAELSGSLTRPSLLFRKPSSIPFRNLPSASAAYDGRMDKKARTEVRFRNFDELIARYDGSPKQFCEATGYDKPDVISQLKGRKRSFGADLARQLEEVAQLDRFALENPRGIGSQVQQLSREPINWPFTFSLQEYLQLPVRDRKDINEAVRKMVVGAQAMQLLNRQRRHG